MYVFPFLSQVEESVLRRGLHYVSSDHVLFKGSKQLAKEWPRGRGLQAGIREKEKDLQV